MMPTISCPVCGHDVPAAAYCIRCGAGLGDDLEGPSKTRGRRTTDFAAFPGEPVLAVRLATTLFPHLPSADVEAFRWTLVLAALAIVAPAALGFYPVALIVAAVAIPILMVLYLYAVDVYEDEPVLVVAATAAWGVVAGVGTGLIAGALGSANTVASPGLAGSDLVLLGVVTPLVGLVLASLGPIALVGHRKFNDVLDGTTFGGVAGAWFAGAQALTVGAASLSGGLTPPGLAESWIVRLLALGVVTPILWAATLGSVMGAVWLRYRAPVVDRGALGPFGSPPVAAVAGAVVLVAAAVGQLLLDGAPALAWLAVLAGLTLIWLRRAIHLGLLQESAEVEIGPPVRCANCGRTTPHHTFCANCGIALGALPKARHGTRDGTPPAGPGPGHGEPPAGATMPRGNVP